MNRRPVVGWLAAAAVAMFATSVAAQTKPVARKGTAPATAAAPPAAGTAS